MGSKGCILVVDDLATNRNLVARRLKQVGFEVIEAESGLEALAVISKRNVDLILLDIMMPEMDGHEVLRIIRGTFSPAALPVIMLTAKSGREDIARALAGGANDYLVKPIDFSVASARVEIQIARKRGGSDAERASSVAGADAAVGIDAVASASSSPPLVADKLR